MSLTFLVGGARSGKSSLAVEIGIRSGGPVTYIATAPITDDDMAARVERHREERPADWSTIEEETDLAHAIASVSDGLIIIDCFTLWTSNLLWRDVADAEIVGQARQVAEMCVERSQRVIAISNEVGLGVHPETELGQHYRDVLGHVNQAVAAAADPTLFLVAGKALPLTDPWQTLDP